MARKRARVGRAASAADAGQEIAIQTHRLTKSYGELVAVDNLNLSIRAGEVFGLLGPNGAGKTTTILMLLGLSEPTSGRAEVVGFDPTREPLEVKRRVGYLPDDVGFYGGLSGRQNLRYTAALNGLDRPRPTPGSATSSSRSDWPRPPTGRSKSIHGACASGWGSPMPSSRTLRSSSSTSRRPRSTRPA